MHYDILKSDVIIKSPTTDVCINLIQCTKRVCVCVWAWQVAEGNTWTEHDLALLSKAVARYPGGVTDRWEKIARMVGRSVKQVCTVS